MSTASDSRPAPPTAAQQDSIAADLIAVLVAVTAQDPRTMTVQSGSALPSGVFQSSHRSLQAGLRAWVEQQTRQPLGYIEQLYTFADRDRADAFGQRVISISYLGLMREAAETGAAQWRSWYRYFPWEDHRTREPPVIKEQIAPRLQAWARLAPDPRTRRSRQERLSISFGMNGARWDEELVVQRYELLFEAGLVPEAQRRGGAAQSPGLPGCAMIHDHRRILATGIARLRAKIKYRPVVFELMPPNFTLLQLQHTVEALAGRLLHKQNFRRLIEQQDLVEETGKIATETGGRPAKLFRFRRQVLLERAVAGTKLPLARS